MTNKRMTALTARLAIIVSLLFGFVPAAARAADEASPILQSARLEEAMIRLTYNEPLDPQAVPDKHNLYVKVNGQPAGIASIAIDGAAVNVTLSARPDTAQPIYVTYLQGDPPLRDLSGNPAGNVIDFPVTLPDSVPPGLVSASVYGDVVTLHYNELLDPASVPKTGNFVVKAGAAAAQVTRVTISGASVQLKLGAPIAAGQPVRITYLRGAPPIRDAAGNDADNLYDAAAVNAPEASGPAVATAVADGASVRVTFDQNLNGLSIPASDRFMVAADSILIPVTRVAISGPVVTLTLDQPVTSSQMIKVSYTAPEVSPLLGVNGAAAPSFDNAEAANRTDNAPPVLLRARTSESSILLTYNEQLAASPIPPADSFSVLEDGDYKPVTQVSIAADTVRLTLGEPLGAGAEITVSYAAPAAGAIRDLSGNAAANLQLQPVASGSDNTPPALVRARVSGTTLTLTYNETLSAASVPPANSFTAAVGTSAITVTGVSVSGTDLRLILSRGVNSDTAMTISYTQPASGAVVQDLNGNKAASFSNRAVGNAGDTTPPALTDATVNGASLKLNFGETLNTAAVPAAASFQVTAGSVLRTVSSVQVAGSTVTLTLASTVSASDSVTLSYTPPASNPIQDYSGNAAPPLAARTVTNKTDLTAPTFVRATVSNAVITIMYSEALDPAKVPAASSFSVYGSSYRTVTSVAVVSSTVVLTLGTPVTSGETVTLSYTVPYSNPLQDLSGNTASGLYSQPLSNGSDQIAPTLSSASVSSKRITLTFSEALSSSSVPNASQFTVMSGQTAVIVSRVSLSGSTVTLELQDEPPSGQNLSVSYMQYGNPLKDSNGNQTASFSNYSVPVPKVQVTVTDASARAQTITITFSRTLDSSYTPSAADFTVSAGSLARKVRSVTISGSTVTLTVSGTLDSLQNVKVSYTPGVNPLQDEAGNLVDAFNGRSVTALAADDGDGSLPDTGDPAPEGSAVSPAIAGTPVDVMLEAADAERTDGTSEQGGSAAVYKLDAARVKAAMESGKGKMKFTIGFTAGDDTDAVRQLIPASVFDHDNNAGGVSFRLITPIGEYDFPVNVIDAASLAAQLHTGLENINIGVEIRKADAAQTAEITERAKAAGLETVGQAVVYETFVEAGGKSYPLQSFNAYMNRKLYIDAQSPPKETTIVWLDPSAPRLVYVPSRIEAAGGRTAATIKHMTNGVYAAVRTTNRQFTDMSSHWAKADVQALASKLIVSGTSTTSFEPNKPMTKAEFITLITRALGMYGKAERLPYKDVPSQAWFRGPIETAYAAGLIDGAERLNPGEPITRAEIAVIAYRAVETAGAKIPLTNMDSSIADKFNDLEAVTPAERTAITALVKAGLMTGSSQTSFVPDSSATRAQAAVMLGRLMKYVGLIDG